MTSHIHAHMKTSAIRSAILLLACASTLSLPKAVAYQGGNFRSMKYGFFVHYVWGGEAYSATVNKDGSVTLRLPSSIGELSFRNIRVAGDTQGYSLGSIVIRGIDLRGSSVTVLANR